MYEKKNVYNCDETGLIWKKLSSYSYIHSSFQGQLRGVKSDKNRITVLLCVSLTGDKKISLVIGTHGKPQCFKNLRYDYSKLKCVYKFNKSAWMNSDIFNEWLKD